MKRASYSSPPCSLPEIEPGVLKWKRVQDPAEPCDGFRVLIDRLWPRGIRKADLPLEAWWKDIAPSPDLRKWFGHRPERFEEFRRRYHAELGTRPECLQPLRDQLDQGPVTLLTATRNRLHNHAVVLVEYVSALPFCQKKNKPS